MASSSDNRARVQIFILGHYNPTFGDIRALRGLWNDIGVVVNHQALFADFDWGKEQLSVSNFKKLKRLPAPLPLILVKVLTLVVPFNHCSYLRYSSCFITCSSR